MVARRARFGPRRGRTGRDDPDFDSIAQSQILRLEPIDRGVTGGVGAVDPSYMQVQRGIRSFCGDGLSRSARALSAPTQYERDHAFLPDSGQSHPLAIPANVEAKQCPLLWFDEPRDWRRKLCLRHRAIIPSFSPIVCLEVVAGRPNAPLGEVIIIEAPDRRANGRWLNSTSMPTQLTPNAASAGAKAARDRDRDRSPAWYRA